MKSISKGTLSALGLTLAVGAASMGASSVFAEEPCVVTDGTINITGSTLCILNEPVETIKFSGTIENLVDVLNAFKVNAGFNFAANAPDAIFEATITNMFSTEGINAVYNVMPDGASVEITRENEHIIFTEVPYTLPAGISIDYTDAIVHLPEDTDLNDALATFNDIATSSTVVAINGANKPTISYEGAFGGTVIHLPAGTSIADALAASASISASDDFIVASEMDYWVEIEDTDDITVHIVDSEATPEEVLAMLAGVTGFNALVVVDGNDSFTITLSGTADPVVNYNDNGGIKAPTAGFQTKAKEADNNSKAVFAGAAGVLGLTVAALLFVWKKKQA